MDRTTYIDYDNDPYFNETPIKKKHYFTRYAVISLSVLALINGGLIAKDYYDSLNWKTSRDSLKMAEMPVDTLNDTGSQATYKENFLVLYKQALKPNGELTANKALMTKLTKALSLIKTAKPIYQAKYDKVKTKYDIKTSLDNLIKSNKTITKKPEQVRNVLAKIAPEINAIYQNNNKDKFVQDEIQRIHNLSDDVNTISSITSQLLTLSTVKHHVMIMNDNTIPETYNKVYDKFKTLHYTWTKFKNFEHLQDQIQNILTQQLIVINHYNDYINDLKDKQNAYADLDKKRNAHKQANADAIREKQEEADRKAKAEREEKEREAEEAKREADEKAEAKRKSAEKAEADRKAQQAEKEREEKEESKRKAQAIQQSQNNSQEMDTTPKSDNQDQSSANLQSDDSSVKSQSSKSSTQDNNQEKTNNTLDNN